MCNPAANYWPGKKTRPGENVSLTSRDGHEFTVHISRPEAEPPYPTVLIISDYFDPDDYYFDLADQYAGEGYLGVCPDFFHRHGDLPAQNHEEAAKRIGKVSDDEVLDDIDVTLEYLRSQGLLKGLAVTGFCWGGRIAYLVAARHPEVKVLIPFYGYVVAASGPIGNKPYSPLEEATRIDARVVGSYGGGDGSISVSDVKEMERRLTENDLKAELKVYDGAPHCFFRTPEWQKDSDDAWGRVVSALKETLG